MLKRHLENAPAPVFSAYCIAAAFTTYFCMYAFRKPFTAATYDDLELWSIGYKTVLVVSQVLGYTLSKFLGIKYVAEANPKHRAILILALIGLAQLALLLFGLVPPPYNFVCLFLNGLPLGMVFGLVLGFLEGRRLTELLTAGLCASFILSSGVVKSVGQWLIQTHGVSDYWMPFTTGLIFAPLLFIGVWMLHQIPPPTVDDETLRSVRAPSMKADRRLVVRRHFFGLTMLVLTFILLTIIRSFRDDFGVEIWGGLGFSSEPEVFAKSEFWVMLVVIAINGAAFLIRDNRTAFFTALVSIAAGFAGTLFATYFFRLGYISEFAFMVSIGVGLYVPYVAYHTTLFERLIAVFRERTNLAHLMYLADSFGYLGYVLILLAINLAKYFGNWQIEFLELFILGSIIIGIISFVLTLLSIVYFYRQMKTATANVSPATV